MKKILFTSVCVCAAVALCSVFANGKDKTKGTLPDLLEVKAASGISIKRTGYRAIYNKEWRLPMAVSWQLTRNHLSGPNKRSGLTFEEDQTVPRPRATNFDYYNSGYSRGHMCPAGDNKWDKKALQETFLFTNICPQLYSLNAGDWNDLEQQCRTWARKYGSVYIICGPILMNQRHRTIGRNKVVVPEAFYKVVLRMDKDGKSGKGIGFVYRNEKAKKSMASYVNSIDQVERLTGLDFFAALPDNMENRIEAEANINDWQ